MNDGGMRLRQTTLLEFRGRATLADHTTAVSLHAHTNRSNEGTADVSRYLERIPLVARLVRRELRAYLRRNGEPVDFKKAWWHPPVDPETVLESETSQIRQVLRLRPVVSITDHDNIDAGLEPAAHTLIRARATLVRVDRALPSRLLPSRCA
jgi:hypothetical protein